jgi:hypothetical protein
LGTYICFVWSAPLAGGQHVDGGKYPPQLLIVIGHVPLLGGPAQERTDNEY